MLNIAHLFDHNKGSRFHLMINRGLLLMANCGPLGYYPDVKLYTSDNVQSLGKIIHFRIGDIKVAMAQADLIFRAGDEHFNDPELDLFMSQKGLWDKTIYYDFSDNELIDEKRLEQCKLYVKRNLIKERHQDKILPLHYCLMPEYIQDVKMPRIIDTVYMILHKPNGINEDMRNKVYKKLTTAKWGKIDNKFIGYSMLRPDQNGRRAIFDNPNDNLFIKYINFLNACKVIWTCGPDHAGGDNRLWEAFGSGALVVTDDRAKKYGFIDGYHCLMYNLDTIDEVIEKVKEMLVNQSWENISKMGIAGRDFALRNHQPINRVQKILEYVKA